MKQTTVIPGQRLKTTNTKSINTEIVMLNITMITKIKTSKSTNQNIAGIVNDIVIVNIRTVIASTQIGSKIGGNVMRGVNHQDKNHNTGDIEAEVHCMKIKNIDKRTSKRDIVNIVMW
jgi:hypothetical protein